MIDLEAERELSIHLRFTPSAHVHEGRVIISVHAVCPGCQCVYVPVSVSTAAPPKAAGLSEWPQHCFTALHQRCSQR
jgi:hypothetical protein